MINLSGEAMILSSQKYRADMYNLVSIYLAFFRSMHPSSFVFTHVFRYKRSRTHRVDGFNRRSATAYAVLR